MSVEQLLASLKQEIQTALTLKDYNCVRNIVSQLKKDPLLENVQNETLPIKKLAMADAGYHQFLIEGILKDCKSALCAKNVVAIEKNLLKIAGFVPSDVLAKLQDRIRYFKISLLRAEHQYDAIAVLAQKGFVDAVFHLAEHYAQPLGLVFKAPHTRKAESFYLVFLTILEDPNVVASLSESQFIKMKDTAIKYIFRDEAMTKFRKAIHDVYGCMILDAKNKKMENANPFMVILNYFKKIDLTQSIYYEEQVGRVIYFDKLQKEYKSKQDQKDQKSEWSNELSLLPITAASPSTAVQGIELNAVKLSL